MRISRTLVAVLLVTFLSAAQASAGIEVRVALDKAVHTLVLASDGPLRITSAASGALLNTGVLRQVKISKHPRGVRVNQLVFPVPSVRIDAPTRVVAFNGKRYRGFIVLRDNGKQSFDVINHVDMEDYLKGVVSSEVPSDWPIEALKAQAVASRTYAMFKRTQNSDNRFDLLSDVNDQVYGGMDKESEKTNEAVEATAGMILTYENQIARAYYHSTSGPRTENATEVFGGLDVPYLRSVSCEFDRESPYYAWQYSARGRDIRALLTRNGVRVGQIRGISIQSHTSTDRVRTIGIRTQEGTRTIEATRFREIIGTRKFKSTRFRIQKQGALIIFKGIGYGHGVGLCQWGAKGMADRNFGFVQILAHYYPGTVMKRGVAAAEEE